jgi:hypothetical protein
MGWRGHPRNLLLQRLFDQETTAEVVRILAVLAMPRLYRSSGGDGYGGSSMIERCCLCRAVDGEHILVKTDLPGSGYRCMDELGCKQRVREIVSAHRDWAAMVAP